MFGAIKSGFTGASDNRKKRKQEEKEMAERNRGYIQEEKNNLEMQYSGQAPIGLNFYRHVGKHKDFVNLLKRKYGVERSNHLNKSIENYRTRRKKTALKNKKILDKIEKSWKTKVENSKYNNKNTIKTMLSQPTYTGFIKDEYYVADPVLKNIIDDKYDYWFNKWSKKHKFYKPM